jgi:MFS family permease
MIAGSTGTANLGSSLAMSISPIFLYVQLGLTPGLVGAAFGLGSIGILAGAVSAAPLSKRFGAGPVIVGSMFASGLADFLYVLLPSRPIVAGTLLFGAIFVGGLCSVTYNVNQVSFRQAITPLAMQGRMNATMRFIVWGTMPLGSVAGGLLASFLPLRTTILIGALIGATAFVWLLASPVRSLREIPNSNRDVEATAG